MVALYLFVHVFLTQRYTLANTELLMVLSFERRFAISNLLSSNVVLGNPLYIDVTLKLLKRLTE